jgi:hypothetical protein
LDAALGRIQQALSEKQALEEQMLTLQSTDLENLTRARERERKALDESNWALYDQVTALMDQKAAAEAAAAAQREIDQERYGLETRLLQLQGNTAGLRRRELEAINPANRALQTMIWELEDAAAAADSVSAALSTARDDIANAYSVEQRALETTRDRMEGFTKRFINFRDSLLLGALSPLTPGQRYAEAASQYAITTAAKNAGDLGAMERFDSVAQAFLEASQVYNASGDAYQRDFYQVVAETSKTVSISQMEYQVAVDSLNRLDLMVNGLVDVKGAVLTVADAIRAMGGLAPAGAGGVVSSLYSDLLGRTPDPEGFNYWNAQLAAGMSQDTVRQWMMNSPEYKQRNGIPLASGMDYVPFDNFPASLHQGERVKTAAQSRSEDTLVAEVKALREELAALRADHRQGVMSRNAATMAAADRTAEGVTAASRRQAWERQQAREAVPQ